MSLKMIAPICLALLAVPGAAQAQMISPMLYEGPRIALQAHANTARSAAPLRSMSRQDPSVAMPQLEAPRPASFRYTPSRERRTRNLAHFVEKSRAADPKGADDLAQLFAQGDIIERMRPELSKYGLSVDNVADAYTVWWINAWQASRGLSGDVSDATTASVRRQVMQSMGSTPEFRNAGDAAKQEMAESLLVQSLLLAGAVEQAKGNRQQLNAVSRAAVQGARGMGVDLQTIRLTEEGFLPADQAGAADPKPGARPAELAQAAPARGADRPPYALIAAAGGAGLGGVVLLGRRMGRKA